MHVFEIKSPPHQGRKVTVTKYQKSASGAEIELTHDVAAAKGKDLQWVQTVSDNSVFTRECRITPHVDPFADPTGAGSPKMHTVGLASIGGKCKADDAKPFYYTDAEDKAGFGKPKFSDAPSINAPKSGRTWTRFVTALTEVSGKNVVHLIGLAWGYDRKDDGTVLMAAIRPATADEMKKHGAALKRMYPDYKYL
jgi:hypothetical protein